jgi:hypothetical protein
MQKFYRFGGSSTTKVAKRPGSMGLFGKRTKIYLSMRKHMVLPVFHSSPCCYIFGQKKHGRKSISLNPQGINLFF